MLGRRCNYDCMYCPATLHDNFSPHHKLEKLKNAWKSIHANAKKSKLPYKICFTGGEVTANKNFLPFIKWLNQKYNIHSIVMTTNGSAGIKYYEKLCKELTSISFSTHSEFMNEAIFFEKAKILNRLMLRPKKSFHINIMNEYWNADRIELYKKFCDYHKISYSVNTIDYSQKTRNEYKNEGKYNLKF